MKPIYSLTLVLLLTSVLSQAQDRYLDPVFSDVEITSDVPYGENFTVLLQPVLGTTSKQPLVMDVYQPSGDTAGARPLVIYLHTGNFLPIQVNGGVTGTKTDSSTVEICKRLAKLGYVVASADYRTGWNPLAETQPERALGLINAAYRGLQDARTCIRFFKRDFAEFGNTYRVDTSKIVVWGQGTGGYIALATATLDEYLEIVTTQMPPGKFLTDLNGDGTPDPMIIEAVNGDINGASIVGLSPGGTIPAGDTLALPNHPGYSSDYQLTVNLGGALGDISWLDEASTPIISFHVPNDQFAPYESDILVVPTTNDPIVEVQGSLIAVGQANALGLNDRFDLVGDDEYTLAAKAASAAAGHEYQEGLYPLNRPLNALGLANGAPWDWWEPSVWDTITHPSAGTGVIPAGASYHFVASLSNMDMSPEKGRIVIDTIIGYYAPRAYYELGLDSFSTSIPQLTKEEVGLSFAPNPSSTIIEIRSSVAAPMKQIRLLDISGRVVLERTNVSNNYVRIEHHQLAPGTYFAQIHFESGLLTQKIIVQ